ncbi:unnamed protein product [Cylicocyclus nassatus]|uniref:G-protein coupled receptors family 1 profile domain-containing protein n=1 Tax=Cylicocyclus nassatus TaxID=53992 RepID=A0AA36HCS6_CYLNA|nr:unnamed protein product [Cylicocyclus nassatus]
MLHLHIANVDFYVFTRIYLARCKLILANFIVLCVWATTKKLRENDCLILLISLAFIDFVYAVLQFPYLIILIAGARPDDVPFDYDPWIVVPLGGPSAALMKAGCTITTAIAIDRLRALYFPIAYYRQSKRTWSVAAFVLALLLAFIDWIVLQLTVKIQRVPGCSSFGCFTNELFRAYWGLSNMMMNLLSCILTVLIVYHLYKRSALMSKAAEVEKHNKSKIDKSANRVALYILLVSALIGVVPGCLNGVGTIVSFKLLEEVSFFVGTCATLSGLSHAFIFGMAHREIKAAIMRKICGVKMLERVTTRVDHSSTAGVTSKNHPMKIAPPKDSLTLEIPPH